MPHLSSFMRFGLVGAVGFLVDGGLLQALVGLADWGVIQARILSFPLAVLATWLLNRHFTFGRADDGAAGRSLSRYVAVSLAGASVNFMIYTALVHEHGAHGRATDRAIGYRLPRGAGVQLPRQQASRFSLKVFFDSSLCTSSLRCRCF